MAQATRLAQVMMPILLLVSVSAVWMGMLNAQHRYLAPAYAPALFNVVSISVGLALLLSHAGRSPHAMLVWSVGTTAAGLTQALVQLPSLWRLGYRPRLAFAGMLSDPGVRRIVKLMAPSVVGLAAIQINVFVNTQFASMLGDGPLTLLNIAFRLFYLPVGLFGVAMGVVTTARASEDAARGDRSVMTERVAEGARAVWMLALPSAVGLVVLAEPVVAVLYQRGHFSATNTAALVPIVQAYMLGVLPYSLVKVYSPAFYAIDRPRVPMMASLTAVAANIAFNAATYRLLGAKGLALGTTLSALVNLGILRAAFGRIIGRPAGGPVLGRAVLAALAMGLLVAAVWTGAARVLAALGAHVALARAVLLFATIAVGFVVYAFVLRLLRYPGADELWQLPRRLGRRLVGRR
jgi:putative peptidoglycan lipid II flippase